MECRLAVVRDDFDPRERGGFWPPAAATITAFILLTGAALLQLNSLFAVAVSFSVAIIVARFIRRRLPDWVGKDDVRGWLAMDPRSIRLEQERVQTWEIDDAWSIHIASNHIQGKAMYYRDAARNGTGILSVVGPHDRFEIKFLVASEAEQTAFREVLSAWYRAGVKVTESIGEERTGILLLRGYRSYADLQRARRELLTPGQADH